MNHQEILERVWTLLERGTTNRRDDFHTCALATIGLDGAPENRTVVFRRVSRQPRFLLCHVDLRSPKVAEIERDQRVSWLFYHVEEKLQLRIRGQATIETKTALADAQWQNSQLFSRRCYCGDVPGTLTETPSSGLPEFLLDREPTEKESEQLGRQNFAVVCSTIDEIDVYELHVRGHRRSLFKWDENGAFEARWLTP